MCLWLPYCGRALDCIVKSSRFDPWANTFTQDPKILNDRRKMSVCCNLRGWVTT